MVENFKTENFKTVTVRIPEEKWKMIKKILVDEDKTFQIILEEALDEFLKKHQNKWKKILKNIVFMKIICYNIDER